MELEGIDLEISECTQIFHVMQVLGLSFGHWELFRLLITTLRDVERLPRKIRPQPAIAEVPTNVAAIRDVTDALPPPPPLSRRNSVSHMEKQVSE